MCEEYYYRYVNKNSIYIVDLFAIYSLIRSIAYIKYKSRISNFPPTKYISLQECRIHTIFMGSAGESVMALLDMFFCVNARIW